MYVVGDFLLSKGKYVVGSFIGNYGETSLHEFEGKEIEWLHLGLVVFMHKIAPTK